MLEALEASHSAAQRKLPATSPSQSKPNDAFSQHALLMGHKQLPGAMRFTKWLGTLSGNAGSLGQGLQGAAEPTH